MCVKGGLDVVANRQKYTRGALGHLLAHFERKKDEQGNYYKFNNISIDVNRTSKNYNLAAADQPLSQTDFIHKRMHDAKCLNRKDVNVMMTWCITLPQQMLSKPPEEQEKFFRSSYAFLMKRYGKENVISAYVHMDETTPHMHFAYTPVRYDVKSKSYKFDAKTVGSKTDLNTFHKDIDRYLTDVMGYETGVITSENEINLTIRQLKQLQKHQLQLQEKIKQACDDIKEPKSTLGMVKASAAQELVEKNKILEETVIVLQEQNEILRAQNELLKQNTKYIKRKRLKEQYHALEKTYEYLCDVIDHFLKKFNLVNEYDEFKDIYKSADQEKAMSADEKIKYADAIKDFDVKHNLSKSKATVKQKETVR